MPCRHLRPSRPRSIGATSGPRWASGRSDATRRGGHVSPSARASWGRGLGDMPLGPRTAFTVRSSVGSLLLVPFGMAARRTMVPSVMLTRALPSA